jgi:expansin (peptidoglycan-binding protein)
MRLFCAALALLVLGCGSSSDGEAVPPVELGAPIAGIATYYDADGSGHCMFDPSPADLDVAAVNAPQYAGAALCGACAMVEGPLGSVTVRLVDECPECQYGHLDLSREAFAKIAEVRAGRVDIIWTVVGCDSLGPIQYKFKDGANQWWTAVQVRNHRLPLARFEANLNGWVEIPRFDYNYFVRESGFGAGATEVRVTAIDGQVLVDTLPPVQAELVVSGSAQFQ